MYEPALAFNQCTICTVIARVTESHTKTAREYSQRDMNVSCHAANTQSSSYNIIKTSQHTIPSKQLVQ